MTIEPRPRRRGVVVVVISGAQTEVTTTKAYRLMLWLEANFF